MSDDRGLHKRKAKKNWTVLAIIFAFAALIWVVTILKMGLQ